MRTTDRLVLTAAILTITVSAAAWAQTPASAAPTPAAADEALYIMGLNIGQQLHQNGVTSKVLTGPVERGIKDGQAGKKIRPDDQVRLQAFLATSAAAAAARNAAAAHDFLRRNAQLHDVTTTASGLQYKILDPGNPNAIPPRPTDLVTVHFRGTLLDGTEFDSSSKPGTASTVQANGVMKAWSEALTLMKPGAEWQLFVPPELGYGQATRLGVPGGSLLIYDIQLLSVSPAPLPPSANASIP